MQKRITIEQLLNFPVDSNCYIITKEGTDKCIVVDPAQGDGDALCHYLLSKNYTPEYIVLTHEHFDHISSAECLRENFGCQLIASRECSERIVHPKKNLSLFRDGVGFQCQAAEIVIDQNAYCFLWGETKIYFFLTPGHSEGGLCFSLQDNLFTGDTVMQNYKPVIKLPGGNKVKLKESIEMLFDIFDDKILVFPGHGRPFPFASINPNSLLPE
jgi:glyoxylase-like metal-dependent hydrolase (beta-lactamase superfamily II)